MEFLRYICFNLCLLCVFGDFEEQLHNVSFQMDDLSAKLDREVGIHRQNLAHMSAILEHVTQLLHRVEKAAVSKVTTPPPPPLPSTPPAHIDDNWRDEVAQAACTGLQSSSGWMFAVRRECNLNARNCEEICASLAGEDSQIGRMYCEDSLHVYAGSHPRERGLTPGDVETLGTKVFRYFDCTRGHCGPNFCCCKGTY